MIKQRTFGYQSRGKRNRQIHDCSENTKEVPYALRNIAAWYIESNANSYGTDDMVALNEIFQHKDPTTRRGSALQQRLTNCCAQQITISNGGIICNIPNVITNYLWQSWESAQSVKSVDRFLIASPQYPPRSSVASVCKQSVNVFMSLCRRDKSIFCGYRDVPETRLYYVRNRTYNPVLGRWLQRDPIGYAGGINLYEYVAGRAVVTLDPWGMIAIPTNPEAIAVEIALLAALLAYLLTHLPKVGVQTCPPNPCPDLDAELAKAATKALKAAQEINDLDRQLFGWPGPPTGSNQWIVDMYKRNQAIIEYLQSLKEMQNINQQLDDAGCP